MEHTEEQAASSRLDGARFQQIREAATEICKQIGRIKVENSKAADTSGDDAQRARAALRRKPFVDLIEGRKPLLISRPCSCRHFRTGGVKVAQQGNNGMSKVKISLGSRE